MAIQTLWDRFLMNHWKEGRTRALHQLPQARAWQKRLMRGVTKWGSGWMDGNRHTGHGAALWIDGPHLVKLRSSLWAFGTGRHPSSPQGRTERSEVRPLREGAI